MEEKKYFFLDDDIRRIISNCKNFTELNRVLGLFIELMETESNIPRKQFTLIQNCIT